MTRVSVVLLAAGSGSRFGGPKQFAELTPGVRMVDAAVTWALVATESVILVLPPGIGWDGATVQAIATGGATRRDSVGAGLAAVPEETDVVIIHDAAHPLAPRDLLPSLLDAIGSGADAAVPFLPVREVVKRRAPDGKVTTVGRDGLGLAQVPMAFTTSSLVRCHRAPRGDDPGWDDSMLIEKSGGRVVAVAGSSRNIHVVTTDDLGLARALAADAM